MDVFSLPFIIGSEDRLRAALTGSLGEEIGRNAEAAGFKILGYWTMGPRQLVNTVRPIRRPDDLKGLKIRVINSPVFLQTFRTLGANPVGLDSAEMYLALQQKTVDGADNAATDIVNLKLYEVTKYLSLTGTIFDFFGVSMNKALWDGLGADEKKIFTDAMNKSMEWEWKAQPEAVKIATHGDEAERGEHRQQQGNGEQAELHPPPPRAVAEGVIETQTAVQPAGREQADLPPFRVG